MKFLGIDYGSKRVGVAVSDDEGKIAFPKAIFANDKNLFENIKKIIDSSFMQEKENFFGIVLGESLNYGGEKNKIMKDIEKFKLEIEKKFNLPIYFEQEFMSSIQARKNKKITTKQQNQKTMKIDDSAAAIILQSFLDKKQENKK